MDEDRELLRRLWRGLSVLLSRIFTCRLLRRLEEQTLSIQVASFYSKYFIIFKKKLKTKLFYKFISTRFVSSNPNLHLGQKKKNLTCISSTIWRTKGVRLFLSFHFFINKLGLDISLITRISYK